MIDKLHLKKLKRPAKAQAEFAAALTQFYSL
jgi:hypothetical protein